MMIMPTGSDHPNVRATAAGTTVGLLDITLAAMGHGNETYTAFPGTDGAQVRVGTQFNISVDPRGRVLALQPPGQHQTLDEGEMIELARAIAADTIGAMCGAAEVFFDSLEYGEGDSCTLFFAYYIAGGSVLLIEEGHAARIRFVSGTVTEIELNFRHYSLTEEQTRLLPEVQALAAAGGEFMLSYADTGAGLLHPYWAKR
jgi:hypothetical protein